MMRTWAAEVVNKAGKEAHLFGWVHARRDMGKIIFIDLRDRSGIVQVVFTPKDVGGAYEFAKGLRAEYVVEVHGKVQKRSEKTVNPKLPTGTVEVLATDLKVLNESKTPPFELDKDTRAVNEETRLKYRYLDLRSERMHRNLILRDRVIKFIRDWLHGENFIEVETPILTKGTPEGAREYIVPARLHPGKFYVLPQAPQQFKQLLMVGGVERYFQIARCFRDEDQRGDRQPEFTQLDLEMSFVEREDVMAFNEALLIAMVKEVAPERHLTKVPFPRLSYAEAIEKYGTDRPDLRRDKNDPNEFAFCWIIDFPFFEKTEEGGWTFTHNPFSAPRLEYMADLLAKRNVDKILTSQYDVVLNGLEIGGGSIRNHQAKALKHVFEIMGFNQEAIKEQFGHMLESFAYGSPPHGGIAWGLDRVVAILANEPNIREVIAFPKTGDARDPMMDAPSELPAKALKEAHIKVVE